MMDLSILLSTILNLVEAEDMITGEVDSIDQEILIEIHNLEEEIMTTIIEDVILMTIDLGTLDETNIMILMTTKDVILMTTKDVILLITEIVIMIIEVVTLMITEVAIIMTIVDVRIMTTGDVKIMIDRGTLALIIIEVVTTTMVEGVMMDHTVMIIIVQTLTDLDLDPEIGILTIDVVHMDDKLFYIILLIAKKTCKKQ
jgi:hypothetical protein